MRKFISLLIVILVCTGLHAQHPATPVFLNHVYIVLDSESYRHIFDSSFLNQIGTESEAKTTTTASAWSGKYFYGLDSYLELFPPNGYAGAATGNFGLGFMTFQQEDIEKLKLFWKQYSNDSMSVDTTTWVSANGKKNTWYYSVSLYEPDTSSPVYTWVMENTPEDLKAIGFTDEEIKKPISWGTYTEKLSHKKFAKAFNRITAIDIVTGAKEYEYLERSFLNFGLKHKHRIFYNDYITVHCIRSHTALPHLKKITIELNTPFDERTLILNDHLILHVKGKVASFDFK